MFSLNIEFTPAYGVYISQLIRYSRACGSYQDFLDRGLPLTRKLLNQGYLATVLFTIYKYRMNYQSLSINKKMSITNRTIKLATADYGNHNHCMSGISALWETQVQRGNNFDVTVGTQMTGPKKGGWYESSIDIKDEPFQLGAARSANNWWNILQTHSRTKCRFYPDNHHFSLSTYNQHHRINEWEGRNGLPEK